MTADTQQSFSLRGLVAQAQENKQAAINAAEAERQRFASEIEERLRQTQEINTARLGKTGHIEQTFAEKCMATTAQLLANFHFRSVLLHWLLTLPREQREEYFRREREATKQKK